MQLHLTKSLLGREILPKEEPKSPCDICETRESCKALCGVMSHFVHSQLKAEKLYVGNRRAYRRHDYILMKKEDFGGGEGNEDDEKGSNLKIDMKIQLGLGTRNGARIMLDQDAVTPEDFTITSTSTYEEPKDDFLKLIKEWIRQDLPLNQFLMTKQLPKEDREWILEVYDEGIKGIAKHLVRAMRKKTSENGIWHEQLRVFYLRYVEKLGIPQIKKVMGQGRTLLVPRYETAENVRKSLRAGRKRVAQYLYNKVGGKYRSMLSRVVNKRPSFGKYTEVLESPWKSIDVRYDYPEELKWKILARIEKESITATYERKRDPFTWDREVEREKDLVRPVTTEITGEFVSHMPTKEQMDRYRELVRKVNTGRGYSRYFTERRATGTSHRPYIDEKLPIELWHEAAMA